MKIARVSAFAVKSERAYVMSGAVQQQGLLPGSEYRRFAPHRQLYSTRSEAALVRIETDDGLVGWGEAQAPIAPEVVLTIVERVLAPALLGEDALATSARARDMYETLRVRGQTGGFQQDAIAAVDIALWDLRARAHGQSLADLLGGRLRDRLPCYVTGLRQSTRDARAEEAAQWARQGFGVKPCLGFGGPEDAAEAVALRDAMGEGSMLAIDGMWGFALPEARRLGRVLAELDVAFLESPLAPEDVDAHRDLTAALDVPVAVGEPLRTRHQFRPWLTARAMDVAQPDVMRNGISETLAITTMAATQGLPVALHTGVVTVVGMAATWQVAATLPTFLVQEYQPVMREQFASLAAQPLVVADGFAHVPDGPGLGIEVDEAGVHAMATSVIEVAQ